MNVVQCPECRQEIQIQPGGWPYVFSQIIVHVDRCTNLPPDVARLAASVAAERYFGTRAEPRASLVNC